MQIISTFDVFGAVLDLARTGLIFHQKPGRNTAGQADPTWPNRAGYSIPCATMPSSGCGELGGGKESRLGARGGGVHSAVLFCVFSFSVSLLLLFPPHPSGRRGGRAAAWPFCCRPQPNYNRGLGSLGISQRRL